MNRVLRAGEGVRESLRSGVIRRIDGTGDVGRRRGCRFVDAGHEHFRFAHFFERKNECMRSAKPRAGAIRGERPEPL